MILDVRDLSVATRDAPAATLLHDINLGVEQGSRVGLVGESGSGKSTTGLALTISLICACALMVISFFN